MPPTNTSFATATDLGTLPADITQSDINDGGTNFTVYYKFTAPANSKVIGAWGFSGNLGSGYRPTIRPYLGPAGAPTHILSIAGQNIPIQFPVDATQEYFLEFTKNLDDAGPNSLRVRVEVAPDDSTARGNIIVNDDAPGFPLAVLSHTQDYDVINFVKDMPFGEAGDILTNGIMLLEDRDTNVLRLFSNSFVQLFVSGVLSGTIRIRRCNGLKFYVGLSKNPVEYATLTGGGVLSSFTTITGETHLESLCANNDETILYFANLGANVPIERWDLITLSALSNLVAGVVDYQIPDILVLQDGSILALYNRILNGDDVFVRRYDSSGNILNTYSLAAFQQSGGTKPRLAYALDDPISFWSFTHPGNGVSQFTNIRCSDGVTLTARLQLEYEGGAMVANETATPSSRFGNSFSCPFFIYPSGEESPSGIYVIVPDKRNDNDIAIPAPTFKTALMP